MGRKRFTAEQIINMLREAEVLLNQDSTVEEVCRKIGISEQTYYRWRKASLNWLANMAAMAPEG